MSPDIQESSVLSNSEVEQFIRNGFIRIDSAFSQELAAEARSILWRDTGCDPNDPRTWTRPVIRLGDYPQKPFVESANTPVLVSAFDQLVGRGRWTPRSSLGSFVVRFPSEEYPGDTGWHVDASFPPEEADPSYHSWRINVRSSGRALLMLFLFSDVSERDAPTRLRVGSHLDVAKILQSEGEPGMEFMALAQRLEATAHRPEALAVGAAGTVYLCHPFVVHAAQRHRGKTPRFLAQPPLYPATRMEFERSDGNYCAVELAIRIGLGLAA